MFRTRLLDKYLRIVQAEISFAPASGPYRPGGRDSAWLAFLKRYLAYRVFSQPNLDPQCPESLVHRAAACLGNMLDDYSNDAILRHITTLCQVGFWEHYCCFKRYHDEDLNFVDDSCNYIDSTSNSSACYDGDGPLKQILLDTAIYVGNVELAKKVYTMEPKNGYYFDPKDNHTWTNAELINEDRLRLAVAHGGQDIFQLINLIELGIETVDQYRQIYHDENLMQHILEASGNSCDTNLIHFLLELGIPWDISKVCYWSRYPFPKAIMCAPLPDIFGRLAALLGPETNALNVPSLRLCCRRDGMIARLNHHAAANNLVMVQYLLDQGAAPYLNNTHTHNTQTLSLHESEPSKKRMGFWQQRLLNPLARAVEVGNTEIVMLMLAEGADPNYNTVATPLMAAVRRNNLGIACLLIEHGANVNLGSPPPVVLAIKGESLDMFQLLIVNGAVITTADTGGRAMAVAKTEGLKTMQDLLMNQGIQLDAVWHHVQSEEEFVLGLQSFEIDAIYGAN